MSFDRTEPPTARRIREARDEGRVARSQELNAAASLLVGAWLLQSAGGRLITDIQCLLVSAVTTLPSTDISGTWLLDLILTDVLRLAPGVAMIVLGLLFTGVAVTIAQTGLLFAHKKLRFDLNKLNPLQGLKRLFSAQGLSELIKALLKLVVVLWVSYTFLRSRVVELLGMGQTDFHTALHNWANLAITLALRVGSAYLLLALTDYAYQRWQYMRSLRMTKEEVKEEIKQQEGDPKIRSRIRSQQRRLAMSRMMSKVPQADVVITNPTHLAIAVQYDPQQMGAPRVLAKGAYRIAERIVSIAREHRIHVTQNIPVARAIYQGVDVDQEIPSELYAAMAEILAYVYRLRDTNQSSV